MKPDIQIFEVDESLLEKGIEEMLPLVSEQRQRQAMSFRFPFGRFASLKSYCMLSDMTGLRNFEFGYGAHGKPSIIGRPDIHFSISHCRKAIAVAVSDFPVGIDIECERRIDDALIRHTMNEAERAVIEADANPVMEFLRLWTRKEAVLKLRGTGITDDLFSVLSGPEIVTTSGKPDYVWSVARFGLPRSAGWVETEDRTYLA